VTLRADLRAALARGVEAESSIAAYAALRVIDPLLRRIARRRLRMLLDRAHLLTSDDSPVHRLRVAALLIAPASPEPDFYDHEVVARAYEALGPSPGPRPRGPWFTVGSVVSLALLSAVVLSTARWLRPFDPRQSDAGRVLGDELATFVVKTSNGVSGSALNETRAQLTGPLAERALGAEVVGALGNLLDASGWVALAKDGSSASPEVERFHNAANDLAQQLKRRNLPYFVDVETLQRGPRIVPLSMSFYVQRESEYRAGSTRVRALDLWRLDTLRVRFGALGYTRPRTPAALILLDQIESDLVRTVLPAVAPGEPAQLVDDETREQGLPWVAPLEKAVGTAIRKHFAALSADPHVVEVGTLLSKRRALVRRWRATLADGRHQLRVPERLIPEADYSTDLHLRVANSELYAWDDLHGDLMSKRNYAAFLAVREPYVLGVERHEVEHRLDFARGFRPVPASLCRMLGVEDALDAPIGSVQERVSSEFSAYLAQLVEAPDSPMLELIVLSTHLLDARSGGGVYWYAALAVLSAVSAELGLQPEQLIGRRVERERVATLLTQLIAQDPKAIRVAARRAYEQAFGEPVPHAVKHIIRENVAWRH
jgi:hypothetical protein